MRIARKLVLHGSYACNHSQCRVCQYTLTIIPDLYRYGRGVTVSWLALFPVPIVRPV